MEIPVRALIEALRGSVPQLAGVWWFGSTARGTARADSDVDLAILANGRLDAVRLFDLAGDLGVLAQRDVDLLDMRQASTVLRAQIVATGKLVWSADRDACERFADDAFSAYANLNEERAGYLADIAARGAILGR